MMVNNDHLLYNGVPNFGFSDGLMNFEIVLFLLLHACFCEMVDWNVCKIYCFVLIYENKLF